MSWINLCAGRYLLRRFLDEDEFEDDEISDDPPAAVPILLACAVLGDLSRLERNAAAIIEAYRTWEADLVSGRRKPTSLLVLQEYLSLSVLLSLIGEEDRGLRAWAAEFPFGTDGEDSSMARIVDVMQGGQEPGGLVAPEGHTEDRIEWPRIAARTPVADLLDLASCPGHEFWHRLQYWMAPAAAAMAERDGTALPDLLRWGRHVGAGAVVLHERSEPPPSEGARGFDAVISGPDGAIGCHDLSMVDAYHTPEDLADILSGADDDWSVSGQTGTLLRIYYNPALDRIRAEDLSEAARQSKAEVTLHSFLDAP